MNFCGKNDVDDLTDNAVVKQINSIVVGLYKTRDHTRDIDPDYARGFLTNLIAALDEMDEMDSFGTEGWRNFIDH